MAISLKDVSPYYQYTAQGIAEAKKNAGNVNGLAKPIKAAKAAEYEAPEAWKPKEEEMVSGRLAKILNTGGPLMTQASRAGERQAQSKGLLGSSLASQYSQQAVLNAATPIAQAEADVFTQIGLAGYQGEIQAALANLDYENQANLVNLQGQMESQLSRQNTLEQDYINQRNTTLQGMISSGLSKQEAQQTLEAVEFQGLINSGLSKQEAEQELEKLRVQTDSDLYQLQVKVALERETKYAQFASDEKEAISNIMNSYGNLYQDAIYNIQSNMNLSGDAKTVAIRTQQSIYNSNMQLLTDLYDVDLTWNI